jgi:hypothetical protein
MKKLLTVIAWTLALNFLAAAGGIVWLYKSHKLDRDKVQKIKELVFTPPATQPTQDTPGTRDPSTQPTLRLEQMMAKVSGRSASEQLKFMQTSFDTQMTLLDRRFQDLSDQRTTLEEARARLDKDRETLRTQQQRLTAAEQAQAKLQTDQGFQETLELYSTMPARQVKTIFMSLGDDTMIQYLRAMEPRVATKIIKEFKSAEENERVGKVLEKMRQAQASTAAPPP